jgi:Ca-activated chloride channel family protein
MRALQRFRADFVPALATLLVGGLLVAVTRSAWPAEPCGPVQVAAQTSPETGSAAVHVVVLSSSNKSAVLEEMACRFELAAPTLEGRPLDVVIDSEASGAAYQMLGDAPGQIPATAWAPAASSWVSMLSQTHPGWVPPETPPSIAQSPQVIAMPRPIAEALGWPDAPLGWSDIVRFATHPEEWDAVAQPGWGAFKLGKTNPLLSTSGLNATVSTFQVVTGTSNDLTIPQLSDPSVLAFVHAVESSAVHYAPTSVDFLRNLRIQDEQGNGEGYVSAILLEEKSVWDYNHGNPSGDPATLGQEAPPDTPLVAFYPSDGALVADHPYVVLGADWVTMQQRAGAGEFLNFLLAPEQQDRFQALGFRDARGTPGPEISRANGLLPEQPDLTLQPPGGDVLQAIRAAWPRYRKGARLLILMDVSGSMDSLVPGTAHTKLELARTAALAAVRQLGPHDEVGLWVFSPASADGPYVREVPMGSVSTNGPALRQAIQDLSVDPGNRTELYATVEAAVSELRADFDPTKINGIVLLSDGANESSTNNDRSAAIRAVVPPRDDEEVRIFTIAYGNQADTSTLTALATSSLGTAYDAEDPTLIGKVFYQVVANF